MVFKKLNKIQFKIKAIKKHSKISGKEEKSYDLCAME